MKIWLLIFFVLHISIYSQAQTDSSDAVKNERAQETLEIISSELSQLTKTIRIFNQRLSEFLEGINKYKGIQLGEKQQRLVFGYEILNQTEQLAATLRKSLVETGEREATIRRRIGQVQFDLRPENIDRALQLQGTTKVEELRENRRRTLESERNTLQNLLIEIEASRSRISENLKEAEAFAQSFRKNLFSQARNAMQDF